VIDHPVHPYTRALMSAIPRVGKDRKERMLLEGDVPSPANPPSGCPFHTRCPLREDRCTRETPPLVEVAAGHQVACHLAPKTGLRPA
jgi:peptide/nickel transport system ATP-binding protein